MDTTGLDVYYLTALDFRTGEVVWEKQVGTGFTFDHHYGALLGRAGRNRLRRSVWRAHLDQGRVLIPVAVAEA
jgi:hypothetical protein